MFVEQLMAGARSRLVGISDGASIIDAAKLLGRGVDLLVVRDEAGAMVGVITRTDIVAEVGRCQDGVAATPLASVMTRDVTSCRPADRLDELWPRVKALGYRNIPITDDNGAPHGVLHARDILQALLGEAETEKEMLRDYVMGVGYMN